MDSVLVTGGAGFIGSHTAEFYANRGVSVTVLDNLSRVETLNPDESRNAAAFNWQYLDGNYEEVRLVEGDVRDREHVEQTVEGHDAVVHTAGQVAVTTSLEEPRSDFEINAEGGSTCWKPRGKRTATPRSCSPQRTRFTAIT